MTDQNTLTPSAKSISAAAAGRGKTKPFGGYPRVSRVGERDERLRSPEFQATAIEAKATAAGVPVEMYPPELDVSGAKATRAILDQIIARIEAGELAGIIVYNLARLSRLKPRERVELVERIEGAGGVILSASESFDTSTPEGRFQRELFFSIARMEWERYAEGFAVAKENAIASGRAIMSTAPYGLRFTADHGLEHGEPAEVELVRELFGMRAAGASYGECLAHFETMSGRSSYRESIKYLLENRVYLGELRYGREVELVNVAPGFEPLVSVELFEAVQEVNRARSREHGRAGGGKAKSLLAGIAKCQGCGRGLVWSRTGSRQTYSYKCPADSRHCSARAHIQADALEAHVLARVLSWAGPVADELVEVEVAPARDHASAERLLAEAERRLRAFAADVELEERDEDAYRAGLKAREARVELRRQERDALGSADELETARGSLREVLENDEYGTDERRQALAVVLTAVVVRRTPTRTTPVEDRVAVLFADSVVDVSEGFGVELGGAALTLADVLAEDARKSAPKARA